MSQTQPAIDGSSSSTQSAKPARVLACVLCQQRKIRCDRQYPCANCVKAQSTCVPATQVTRRRKRRFPERELLERLHHYEDLLRQNHIKFVPLHKNVSTVTSDILDDHDPDDSPMSKGLDEASPKSSVETGHSFEPKNMWHAMSHEYRENDDSESSEDDVRSLAVKAAFDHFYENDDQILFGSRKAVVDISTFHPEPVQIFRLWQIYLDNVNPLLKITHTPTLQGQIIEAASDILHIKPAQEALMFAIYSIAVSSLEDGDCAAMLGDSKSSLLTRYQFGCQQALLNYGILRCDDRDALTALYLYFLSFGLRTIPQSLSSLLGIAIRIAQRMGLDSESSLAKHNPLEAEMRRRLWWSLVLFDARIGELAEYKAVTLNPMWDCKVPLNINDSDIRAEMRERPRNQEHPSEAIFCVVRGQLGDYVRHAAFHLDFNTPALKAVARAKQIDQNASGGELADLDRLIDEKYIRLCDPENPLHFMTIWTTRNHLARYKLIEYLSRSSTSSAREKEAQRAAAIPHAIKMLECDTRITVSPLTKRFRWQSFFYFPFPAYLHLVLCLKRMPLIPLAEQAWVVMSENYEARFGVQGREDKIFFKILGRFILQAWTARDRLFKQAGVPLETPSMIFSLQHRMEEIKQGTRESDMALTYAATYMGFDQIDMATPTDLDLQNSMYGVGEQELLGNMVPETYSQMYGPNASDVDINHLGWSAMNWHLPGASAGTANDSTETSKLPRTGI